MLKMTCLVYGRGDLVSVSPVNFGAKENNYSLLQLTQLDVHLLSKVRHFESCYAVDTSADRPIIQF